MTIDMRLNRLKEKMNFDMKVKVNQKVMASNFSP